MTKVLQLDLKQLFLLLRGHTTQLYLVEQQAVEKNGAGETVNISLLRGQI